MAMTRQKNTTKNSNTVGKKEEEKKKAARVKFEIPGDDFELVVIEITVSKSLTKRLALRVVQGGALVIAALFAWPTPQYDVKDMDMSAKTRVTIDLSGPSYDRLDRLQGVIGAESKATVIRTALKLLEFVAKQAAEDRCLYFEDAKGERTQLAHLILD